MEHARLFEFESDFVATLRCIPMSVRFKLDRVGVKLTLRQWSRFTHEDRERLLHQPCETEDDIATYRARLVDLVALRAGEQAKALAEPPDEAWRDKSATPPAVVRRSANVGLSPPTADEWSGLSDIERFVLLKLSRDNHDNVNFAPALREFGLRPGADATKLGAASGG